MHWQKNSISVKNVWLLNKPLYHTIFLFLIHLFSFDNFKVLRKKKKSVLSALLQVISYIASKWQARRQRCRWKLTLTIVESLTNIATMVPGSKPLA